MEDKGKEWIRDKGKLEMSKRKLLLGYLGNNGGKG